MRRELALCYLSRRGRQEEIDDFLAKRAYVPNPDSNLIHTFVNSACGIGLFLGVVIYVYLASLLIKGHDLKSCQNTIALGSASFMGLT